MLVKKCDIKKKLLAQLFLYDIFVRLHGLPVHQVFQCYMIHHTFDSIVQLFPEDLGDAVLLTVTDGSVVVQTFHRGKASFCETKDHSDRVFIRGLLQCIAALRATDTADKACFVQDGR